MKLKLVTIQMNARACVVGSLQASKAWEIGWLLAKAPCACDSPSGSCSSAESDSIGLGQGLCVCIYNKLQVITILLVSLRDKTAEQIFY